MLQSVTRIQSMHMELWSPLLPLLITEYDAYGLTVKSQEKETDLLNNRPTGFLPFLQASAEAQPRGENLASNCADLCIRSQKHLGYVT